MALAMLHFMATYWVIISAVRNRSWKRVLSLSKSFRRSMEDRATM